MVEQIQIIIELSGYEATEDEYILAEIFAENDGHHSLSTLRRLFSEATGRDIRVKEIKEFMDFLCEYGAAEKKSFPDGAKYEHRHIGEHHDHLVCSKCSKVVEFAKSEIEELQKKIAESYGFTLYRHVLDLFGICDNCRRIDQKKLGLDKLSEGETIVVSRIDGGKSAVRHLADLGISEGIHVKLIRRKPMPFVSVGDTRFAIGHGLANKIYGVSEQETIWTGEHAG